MTTRRQTRHDPRFEQIRSDAIRLEREARRAVDEAFRAGWTSPRRANAAISRMFRDATDAYLVALDAGLEANINDTQLLELRRDAQEAASLAFRWRHDELEGSGWIFTGARIAIDDEEARRLLRGANAVVLEVLHATELRPIGPRSVPIYVVELRDQGRVVHIPSFELTVSLYGGERVVLGRTTSSWSEAMVAHDLDPTPRWYVRQIADWERSYRS